MASDRVGASQLSSLSCSPSRQSRCHTSIRRSRIARVLLRAAPQDCAGSPWFFRSDHIRLWSHSLGSASSPSKRFSLKPSNGRARRPYNSQSTDADIRRDLVVTHGLCHCEYNTENECTGSWDSRSCNLSTFGGIDIFFT